MMKKFMKLFIVCLLGNPGESFADEMAAAHQAGASFSREQGGKVTDVPRSGDLQAIPQYEAPSPQETRSRETQSQETHTPHYIGASLSEAVKSLGSQSRERQSNERGPLSWKKPTSPAIDASDFIHQSKAERGVFPLDPEIDPLLQYAKEILESTKNTTEEDVLEENENTSLHTCFESLEPQEASCVSTLDIKAHLTQRKPKTVWYCDDTNCNGRRQDYGGWGSPCGCKKWILLPYGEDCVGTNHKNICDRKGWTGQMPRTWKTIGNPPGPNPYEYEQEGVIDSETWADTCTHLESLSDEGKCAYVDRICTQGPETRVISGVSVYRECWQYRSTYLCEEDQGLRPKDGCKHLKGKGCFQIASSCAEHTRVGHAQEPPQGCALYKQTYQCLEGGKTKRQRSLKGINVFCGDGNCADQTYAANQDMLDSISKLHLLKEMQQDLGTQPFAIFKGEDRRCSKSCLGFSDCCGLSGGWGESFKMTSCSGEEKDLSQRRAKGLCRLVGTYCAEKEDITKVCLRKKTSYCCFPSKLVRLFQEQGRAQLGLGWGAPEHPSCRGLTVEELQKVDFSKIETQEIFQEIASTYRPGKQAESQEVLKQKTLEGLKSNMEHLKSGLKPGGI